MVCFLFTTGMPEETGPQTVSGCVPAEARPADHQIPAHAEGVANAQPADVK